MGFNSAFKGLKEVINYLSVYNINKNAEAVSVDIRRLD
jgi:hypothetical protein